MNIKPGDVCTIIASYYHPEHVGLEWRETDASTTGDAIVSCDATAVARLRRAGAVVLRRRARGAWVRTQPAEWASNRDGGLVLRFRAEVFAAALNNSQIFAPFF